MSKSLETLLQMWITKADNDIKIRKFVRDKIENDLF